VLLARGYPARMAQAPTGQPLPDEPDRAAGRAWRWLAAASGLIFLLLASHAAWVETPTNDEFAHVPAGCAYWTYGRFDLYAKNPPFWKMVMAIPVLLAGAQVPELRAYNPEWAPVLYGHDFLAANEERYLRLIWLTRMVTILATLGCGAVLFVWSTELFDERAAGITTLLFYLNPNILAHGHLATIDVACALTILLALFTQRWSCRRPGFWRKALAGAVWGLALATKFTAVLLLPVLLLLVLLDRRRQWRWFLADSAVLLATAWLTVNAWMAFQGTFTRLGDYSMVSGFGSSVQRALPGWLPVPLPRSYVEGFDQQKNDLEHPEWYGNYLFGTWSAKGWWYYNLVALVVKNPLPLVVLVLVAPWFWWRWRRVDAALWEIVLPGGVLLVSMLLFNRLNIGVRYLLPLFPLALLLTSAVWHGRKRWQPWLAGLLIGLHAVTAAVVHPAYLSYFNLAVGGPAQGHFLLLDSNLDWGQDLYRVPQALREIDHRGPVGLLYFGNVPPHLYGIEYYLPPTTPAAGVMVVSLQYLMGGSYVVVGPDGQIRPVPPGYIAWLGQYQPRVKAGTIWIFDTRDMQAPKPE
jgi:hypothetical protein